MEKLVELIKQHDFFWSMIDEQKKWDEGFQREKKIKEMLCDFEWLEIEPLIQDGWRKEAVKRLF